MKQQIIDALCLKYQNKITKAKADIEGYFIIPESDVIDEMRIVVSVDNEINIIADTEKKLKVIANHYTSSKI